ncbi:hypothetical protein KFL_005110020 [Klebsormidium nitens]|uniref:DNA endonuclease activator Ctp1 C-terminal domain-containing protein n=1 Tax=Klebsormidium nitens TaxID=105231 RepID=A0A1Y1IEI2_KLENI|nr:hypothetical protein KFL_005110020 [Klebsormidium nitens]|eukprot:GAQ89320.1 hypothetical protein KFL_005110020 [Klebsormidium nitens]
METQLDDIEIVEEQCSALISELGLVRAKVDQAEQSLAGRVLPAFRMLVARHSGAVQQLEAQRRDSKAEMERAQQNFLVEKEALLVESKLARQRLVQERDDQLEEKEKLWRQLVELRASREEDQQRSAEKLLNLERRQQEERQRLTAALDAEKEEKAALSRRYSRAKREVQALHRNNASLLQAGVNASQISRASKSPTFLGKELRASLERVSPQADGGHCFATQGSVGGGKPPTAAPKQAAAKVGLPLFASSEGQPSGGLVRQTGDAVGGRPEVGPMQAAQAPMEGLGAIRSDSRDLQGRGEEAKLGAGLEGGVGFRLTTADEMNQPGSGEKRPRTDLPEVLAGACGGMPADGGGSGEGSGEGDGKASLSHKRRKHVGGNAEAPPPVSPQQGMGADCPISSMETLLLVRGTGGELTLEEREAAWEDGADPTPQSGTNNGMDVRQNLAGREERLDAGPVRSAGHLTRGFSGKDATEAWASQAGSGGERTRSASGGGSVKRDRSQLVSTLNRQIRQALGAERSGGRDGLEVTPSVSADPRVLGARDENERSGASKERLTSSEGGSPRTGRGQGDGRTALRDDRTAEPQVVSEGAVRDRAPDSDTDEAEVSSPKRRRRARSAGIVGPSDLGRDVQRGKSGDSFCTVRNLGTSSELDGGKNVPLRAKDSLELEEAVEFGNRASNVETRAVPVARAEGLPPGEKGRWVSVREVPQRGRAHWVPVPAGRAEQVGRKEGPIRMVQTRLSQPPRKDAPFFKAPTSAATGAGEGPGRKWREASRGVEDDFLSTPMEKALAGRSGEGGPVGGSARVDPPGRQTGQTASDEPRKAAPTGRNSMARDLGTGSGERRAKVEERTRAAPEDTDRVSDSEKENSQPDADAEVTNEAGLAHPDGARPGGADLRTGDRVPRDGDDLRGDRPRNRGIQVIKPGTYQHTAAERGRQLAAGEAPVYKYNSVVRKKDEREQLHAMDCENCRKFYEAVEALDAEAMERHVNSRCQEHLDVAGRHRYQYAPPATPSGFWNIGFDSETEAAS